MATFKELSDQLIAINTSIGELVPNIQAYQQAVTNLEQLNPCSEGFAAKLDAADQLGQQVKTQGEQLITQFSATATEINNYSGTGRTFLISTAQRIQANIRNIASISAQFDGKAKREAMRAAMDACETTIPDEATEENNEDPGANGDPNSDNQNDDENQDNDDQGDESTGSGDTDTTIQQTSGANPSGTTTAGKSGNSNKTNNLPGKRLENPFGNFSSYNYLISLYMITPDAYDVFNSSGRKNINVLTGGPGNPGAGAYLIAQSAGVNNTTTARAPGFELDYYIDDLVIKAAVSTSKTGGSFVDYKFNFNITEPHGFSFISKLKQALETLKNYSQGRGLSNSNNATRQFFVLGVKFQGYDAEGNLVVNEDQLVDRGAVYKQTSNEQGVFEKYFDIQINEIKFKVDGKTVVYQVDAAGLTNIAALTIKRGMIDRDLQLEANKVSEAFTELTTILNKDQERAATKNPPEIKQRNNYSISFYGGADLTIGKASLVSKADQDKRKWPMSKVASTSQSTPSVEVKSAPNPNQRQVKFKGQTPIVQAINQLIAQSTYLEDALKSIKTAQEEPNQDQQSDNEIKKDTNTTIKWYNVAPVVSNARFDELLGDWAFDINYVIQPYETPVIISAYANQTAKYYGPYKRYDYWYTGLNSEVTNFELTLNNAFTSIALNPTDAGTAQGGGADIPIMRAKRNAAPTLGKLDVGMESQNNYITSLTDAGAYAKSKISILGDPDFLMDMVPDTLAPFNQFYGSDGFSIKPNGGQLFIEVNFYEGIDYEHKTGLMDINENIQLVVGKYPKYIQQGVANRGGGIIFMVHNVVSSFRGGKFTQDLELAAATFTDVADEKKKDGSGRENNANDPNGAKVARQGTGSASDPSGGTGDNNGLLPEPNIPNSSANEPTEEPFDVQPADAGEDTNTQQTAPASNNVNNGVVQGKIDVLNEQQSGLYTQMEVAKSQLNGSQDIRNFFENFNGPPPYIYKGISYPTKAQVIAVIDGEIATYSNNLNTATTKYNSNEAQITTLQTQLTPVSSSGSNVADDDATVLAQKRGDF